MLAKILFLKFHKTLLQWCNWASYIYISTPLLVRLSFFPYRLPTKFYNRSFSLHFRSRKFHLQVFHSDCWCDCFHSNRTYSDHFRARSQRQFIRAYVSSNAEFVNQLIDEFYLIIGARNLEVATNACLKGVHLAGLLASPEYGGLSGNAGYQFPLHSNVFPHLSPPISLTKILKTNVDCVQSLCAISQCVIII